jgi:DNA-binding transcriptional MerR regulator
VQEYPQKEYYRLSEVCRYTDTQPYVLRHWQSEFPQLKPSSVSGQPMYRKRVIELVKRIKELLYEEEYSLDAAREALASGKGPRAALQPTGVKTTAGARSAAAAAPPPREWEPEPEPEVAESASDVVPRQRYEDAVDEIEHLRLAVKEAELKRQKAEDEAQRLRQRAESAIERLEQIERLLSRNPAAR